MTLTVRHEGEGTAVTDKGWSRVEGVVIAPGIDPMTLAEYLREQAVIARLEWYESSPDLVAITALVNEAFVGGMDSDGDGVKPGRAITEFVSDLADRFGADVMLGEEHIDRIPQGSRTVSSGGREEPSDEPIRVVEIGHTPASAVPLIAAFEGVDIAEADLSEGKRLLVAQLPPRRAGWYFGDAPLVALTMQGDEFQVLLAPDDDPESVVTYSWATRELTVAGAKGWDQPTSPELHALVGSLSTIEAIQAIVPAVDLEEAFRSTQKRGGTAVIRFGKALGLSDDVIEFLLGLRPVSQIAGTTLHEARGVSNAIGRSVDMIMHERQEKSKFWGTYTRIVRSKPWLIPLIASAEMALGATLLITGRRRDGKRSVPGKIGTFLGTFMMLDSMADVALAKYVYQRELRREEQGAAPGRAEGR